MTQEEVDLIYDYLHENYEYKDGELIRKNGEKLGSVATKNNSILFRTSLLINGEIKHFIMKKLMYIYYKKQYADFVLCVDGNEFNLHEINLLKTSLNLRKKSSFCKSKYNKKEIYKIYYYNQDKKLIHLGATPIIKDAEKITEILDELFLIKKLELKEIISYLKMNFDSLILKEIPNKLNVKGVFYNEKLKSDAKYIAKIRFNGKSYVIGYFLEKENASKSYLYVAKKIKTHGSQEIESYINESRIKYHAKERDFGLSNMRGVAVRNNGTIWARYADKYLGCFKSVQEAHDAYLKAKMESGK